jgi:hypothetical protein
MGSLDLLLDIPTIPRVLKLLIERGGECAEATVTENLPAGAYAGKAIETLHRQGIIEQEEGRLRIVKSAENDRTINGIIGFYSDTDRVTRRRLLFRGILNAAQYACMVHLDTLVELMEAEGFTRPETEGLIQMDGKRGYVERQKIIYRTREGLKQKTFSFIPLHYYPHFIAMKSDYVDRLKERFKGAGISLTEEEYVLGHYPTEIATQSREYLRTEKESLQEKIKNEAFDIWWYYRF